MEAQSLVHLGTVENLMRSSGGTQGTQQDQSTHRMKGKTFAWRMQLPSPFGLDITKFLS